LLGFRNSTAGFDWIETLDIHLKNQRKYLVIILDAVNECQDLDLLKKNLVIIFY